MASKNSFTARRTRAETGVSDFFDIAVSAFTWLLVSQTTVLFMTLECPVAASGVEAEFNKIRTPSWKVAKSPNKRLHS